MRVALVQAPHASIVGTRSAVVILADSDFGESAPGAVPDERGVLALFPLPSHQTSAPEWTNDRIAATQPAAKSSGSANEAKPAHVREELVDLRPAGIAV